MPQALKITRYEVNMQCNTSRCPNTAPGLGKCWPRLSYRPHTSHCLLYPATELPPARGSLVASLLGGGSRAQCSTAGTTWKCLHWLRVSGWRRGRRVLACDVAAAAGPGRRQPRWPLCPTRGRGQFPVHNSGTGPCKYNKLSSLAFRSFHLKFYYPTKRIIYLNKNFSGAHLNPAISSGSDPTRVWAGPVARSCVT